MENHEAERRQKLYEFVKAKHKGQVRKYTGEPYFNHVKAVAEMADGLCKFGYEIGLCHDLLEDTDCSAMDLRRALDRCDYNYTEQIAIAEPVYELTDKFTSEDFPQLNRAKRKALEADRLHKISYEAQTVKYCDLMHNTASIIKHDPGFAVKYLAEKATILKGMDSGNPAIYRKCKRVLKSANKQLN